MIFNLRQIKEILAILQKHQLVFIAEQLGLNFLSQAEINLLVASGIDINLYKNAQGIVEQAYMFGLLAEALGDSRAKKMNYAQFKNFLKSGNFVPLSEEERFALDQVKNRVYTDITGLGSRIAAGTSNIIIRANAKQVDQIRNIVKEKSVDAVKLRKSATQLASDLGHATDDWERDWLRIAYYVLHEAYNYGRARSIFKAHGEDAEVYFDVYENACHHCRELYLENSDDLDSKPKVFKLKDVLANGNNIGRKAADWLPTVSPIHPYCRCTINFRDKNFEWDAETRSFTKPKKYVPKNKKLQGVKLNIKVKKG
jgi:hypothetical protein